MSHFLEHVLAWAERQLPEGNSMWISDLRSEAGHISDGLRRQRFLWSGTIAALGQVLRVRVGVQRVGQTLLGLAILTFCLGGLVIGPNIENAVVKLTFYSALPIYAVMGAVALFSLNLMRRLSLLCIASLCLFWLIAGLNFFTATNAPVYFFRAFALEMSCIMAGLYIAASYLGWAGDAELALSKSEN